MTGLEILILSASAFCTSALTAVVGAGGGTALIAIMLQVLSPAAAIPVHGAVQLASNTTRVYLLWRHMHWPIILRFALLMPFGVWLGLAVFQGLPAEAIQILIGCFVLSALNMVVGVIAPILGVLIIRRDLSKEAMVGTLGFFGFLGNLLKIAGFALIGFSFVEFGPLMAGMIPAAVIGTRVGRAVLSKMDETYFLIAFRIVLVLLAAKLILVDGLGVFG